MVPYLRKHQNFFYWHWCISKLSSIIYSLLFRWNLNKENNQDNQTRLFRKLSLPQVPSLGAFHVAARLNYNFIHNLVVSFPRITEIHEKVLPIRRNKTPSLGFEVSLFQYGIKVRFLKLNMYNLYLKKEPSK